MKEPSFDEEPETPNLDFYDNEQRDDDEKNEAVIVTIAVFCLAVIMIIGIALFGR